VITKPDKVVVKGPKTLLGNMSSIATLPIDVTGRRTSFRERVELTPLRIPEEMAERRWVEVDVRIAVAASIDTAPGPGVEEKP
jgi:hypothetical protein